jgi:ligand-binding SRPBCC domain-containing protein
VKIYFNTVVQKDLKTVKAGFTKDLFKALKPPGVSLEIEKFDGCTVGSEVHLKIKSVGPPQKWVSLITEEKNDADQWYFIDEGRVLPWPLTSWKHVHRVIAIDEKSSSIIDDITYECAHPLVSVIFYPALWFSFSFRPARYKTFFEGT